MLLLHNGKSNLCLCPLNWDLGFFKKIKWLPDVWYLRHVFFTSPAAALWQANVFTDMTGTHYVKPTQTCRANKWFCFFFSSCWQLRTYIQLCAVNAEMQQRSCHNLIFHHWWNKFSCVVKKKWLHMLISSSANRKPLLSKLDFIQAISGIWITYSRPDFNCMEHLLNFFSHICCMFIYSRDLPLYHYNILLLSSWVTSVAIFYLFETRRSKWERESYL